MWCDGLLGGGALDILIKENFNRAFMWICSWYQRAKYLIVALLLAALFSAQVFPVQAITIFSGPQPDANTSVSNTDTFILDNDNSGTDVTLQFGATLNESLRWDSANLEFDLSDDLNLTGGLTTSASSSLSGATISGTLGSTGSFEASGNANIGDGGDDVFINSNDWDISSAGVASGFTGFASSGTFSTTGSFEASGNANIGDGGDDAFINSNDWDISSAGVASGFTGLTSTGVVNFTGASSFSPHQGASDPVSCAEGQQFYNSTSNTLKMCTATDTWTALGTSNPDFESVYSTDADDTLTTSNGAFTVATGTNDFIVDSNDWNVTAAGALDTASITSNGALTVTGTTSLNGVANIGDGGDDIAINSNDWDISSAGVGSGFTGFTSTGTISLGDNSGTVVFDGTNFDVTSAGAVTLTGHMTLSGDASEGLSGGGLVDCDVQGQRLQWDVTTNKFSCTTIGPDTATFSDTSPATMADNNTTELFNDATRPNITTDSTSSTVLISVVITDAAAVAADDEFDAVRIIRETDGTNPSCAADPQVGPILQGGFVTAATHPWGITATVLDTPGFAGNIRYTVCTSAQSVGTVDNVPDRIDVTLVELGN